VGVVRAARRDFRRRLGIDRNGGQRFECLIGAERRFARGVGRDDTVVVDRRRSQTADDRARRPVFEAGADRCFERLRAVSLTRSVFEAIARRRETLWIDHSRERRCGRQNFARELAAFKHERARRRKHLHDDARGSCVKHVQSARTVVQRDPPGRVFPGLGEATDLHPGGVVLENVPFEGIADEQPIAGTERNRRFKPPQPWIAQPHFHACTVVLADALNHAAEHVQLAARVDRKQFDLPYAG